MKYVGRAFGFYIKHWQEMEALYGAGESERMPLLRMLSEENRNKIEEVGRRAEDQAWELTKDLGKALQSHFKVLCKTRIRSRRKTYRRTWEVEVRLWPGKSEPKPSRWRVYAYIEHSGRDKLPVVFLYFWVRGGQPSEDALVKMLGKRECHRWEDGGVAFDQISIIPNQKFDVEKDALIKRVSEALKTIQKKDIERLFKI